MRGEVADADREHIAIDTADGEARHAEEENDLDAMQQALDYLDDAEGAVSTKGHTITSLASLLATEPTAKVDAAFFPGGKWKSNFLINLGHGDPAGLRPRAARPDFDDACRIL